MPKNLKNLCDRLPRPHYRKESYETGRKLTAEYNTPTPDAIDYKAASLAKK